jgi:hypothetical protein
MRRTLAVNVLVAAAIALAACGGGKSPSATGTTAAGAPTTAGAPAGGGTDPVCAEVTQTIEQTRTKTVEEIAKAATASDADVQKSLQTIKQLYTDTGSSIKTAAGKAASPELKSALETLSSEATKAANSLDPSIGASQAIALMDRTKVTAAAERVLQVCGRS